MNHRKTDSKFIDTNITRYLIKLRLFESIKCKSFFLRLIRINYQTFKRRGSILIKP